MKDAKEFIDSVRTFNCGRYDMRQDEYAAMRDASKGDSGALALFAYRYGIMRGQRMERNRRKKKGVIA